VAYEVWTKSGSWHGHEGKLKEFQNVASGNVTTWGAGDGGTFASGSERETDDSRGEPTRIPHTQFTPIQIDGGGARQSIYLTLSSKHLLYARSSTQSTSTITESITSIAQAAQQTKADTIEITTTSEMTVYEGAAVMTYPFSFAKEKMYYRMPRGFIGRIWYLRNPCKEIYGRNEDGSLNETLGLRDVVRWEDCSGRRSKEQVPSLKDLPPFFSQSPTDGSNNNGETQLQKGLNGTIPTFSPTNSHTPTINTMKVNLILTLQNVASNRILNQEESSEFEQLIMEFYEGMELLVMNEVELYKVQIHYQQTFVIGDDEKELGSRLLQQEEEDQGVSAAETPGEGETPTTAETSTGGNEEFIGPTQDTTIPDTQTASSTNSDEPPTAISSQPSSKSEEEDGTVSLEVTLIISILYCPLPQQITRELLQSVMINNKDAFVSLLKSSDNGQQQQQQQPSSLSEYFSTLTSIPSILTTDKLTLPPTPQPTFTPTLYNSSLSYATTLSDNESSMLSNTTYVVAIIFGLIYASLAMCSMCYVKRARQKMRIEQQKMFVKNNVSGGGSQALVGHGMQYEDDKDEYNGDEAGGLLNKSKSGRSGRSSLTSPLNRKNKVDDDQVADKANQQYEHQMDEENEHGSYYSEGKEEEGLSSMEDSYYSEDEESSDGSYYSGDEEEADDR